MKIPDGTAAVFAYGFGFGESRSLEDTLGRPIGTADLSPRSMSQKTYEVDSPIICVDTDGVLVAEKRLRCYSSGTAAYLHLGGM